MNDINIKNLVENTGSESGIIFDSKGSVLESFNIEKEENIAAMGAVMVTMVKEFFEDALNAKDLTQMIFKSEQGVTIMNQYGDVVICLLTHDVTKAGLISLMLNKAKK